MKIPSAKDVYHLREMTGCGLEQCRAALEKVGPDLDLTAKYLKYLTCAVNLKGTPRHDWALRKAKEELKMQDTTYNMTCPRCRNPNIEMFENAPINDDTNVYVCRKCGFNWAEDDKEEMEKALDEDWGNRK